MQDLTTGSVVRHLLKTASFMLVTMVFQTLYSLVDLYWVGRLGKEAVAGVGIAGNLTFIVLAISQMLGVGVTTLVSHATGQRDHQRALFVFNQSQVLSVGVGVAFLILGLLIRVPYVDVQFLRANTGKRIKITLPGPFTMAQQAQDDYYKDEEALAMAYAAAVNEELKDLKRAGADVVQLDEP